ncbi:MAG TPA: acyl-CoA dehydrogenase family protein [Polyangia bacterium]|nr:acyl-CoA dehydrogenase family protein [Polyangia bacterium]
MSHEIDSAIVERAARAGELIAPLAAQLERERRLPDAAVRALADAGVFKLLVPRRYGGSEASLATLLAVCETIARADGSAGWCAMIGASSGLMCAFLDDAAAREVFGDAGAIACGVFAPMGRATPVAGGLRVSGRWPFASGCEHSTWRTGGTIVEGAALLPSGMPDVRSVLFRASESRVIDTWDVSGLRGTGSHDLAVEDLFVPAERSFSLISDRPKQEGALYALPFFGVLAASVSAVALGIARAAIDALAALAAKKQPFGARRSLAHRELVQLEVARAEARVRAARAFLFEAAGRAVDETGERGAASVQTRALLRLAAAHAARESAAAVDAMYGCGGATSIYAHHPLQRQFRDVHVATQHIMVSPTAETLAGRILLGLDADVSTL